VDSKLNLRCTLILEVNLSTEAVETISNEFLVVHEFLLVVLEFLLAVAFLNLSLLVLNNLHERFNLLLRPLENKKILPLLLM